MKQTDLYKIQTERQKNYNRNSLVKSLSSQKFTEAVKSKSQWSDELFPAEESSIYSSFSGSNQCSTALPKFLHKIIKNDALKDLSIRSSNKKFTWERLSELYKNEFNIMKETKNSLSDDIVQGELGDCYFLSILEALATYDQTALKNLVVTKTSNKNGVYEVKCYIHGETVNIILDEFVPTAKGQLAFARLSQKSLNIWPVLLEKAWAKVNLNYENIIDGTVAEAFEFLSPAPYLTLYHTVHRSCLFHEIQEALKSGYFVLTDITATGSNNSGLARLQEMGLVTNHAYSVIETGEVCDIKGKRTQLVKIRNPWGTNEWEGDWSDSSNQWTEEAKKLLDFEAKEDGIFWMSVEDYCRFYTTTFIFQVKEGYSYNSKKFQFNPQYNYNFLKVTLSKATSGAFILNQKSERLYRQTKGESDFSNHFASMLVLRRTEEGYSAIGSDAGAYNRLSVQFENLQKGDYYIAVNFPHPSSSVEIEEQNRHGHLDHETLTYSIGCYSGIPYVDIEATEQLPKEFLIEYCYDLARQNPEKYFFEEEGEKNCWRAASFPSSEATHKSGPYGYIFYENTSEGFINEQITLSEFYGVNIIPRFVQLGSKSSIESLVKNSEEEYERQQLKRLDQALNSDSSLQMLRNKNPNEQVSKSRPIKFQMTIGPNSRAALILEKHSNESGLSLESELVVTYPLHSILSERLFPATKTRIKYQGKQVEIYEIIIEHNSGVLIKYRNRTNLVFAAHLKFQELKNLSITMNSDELKAEEKHDHEEGLEVEELAEDKEIEALNEFNLEVKDKSRECVLFVRPNEVKFVQLSAVDVFQSFSYSMDCVYHTNVDSSY